MRLAIYTTLMGLTAMAGVSCQHKELCYDHTHTGTINITFDWQNALEAEANGVNGMYLYFYSVNGGAPQQFYLPKEGGTLEITQGEYKILGINSDTEATMVRGETNSSTFELYTREASVLEGMTSVLSGDAPKAEGTEAQRTVLPPDPMYAVRGEGIIVLEDIDNGQVVLYPEEITSVYTYEITNVKNLEYVSDVSGTLSGLSPSYYLEQGVPSPEYVTVPFSTKSDGVSTLSGSFFTFGCSDAATKAPMGHQMVIYAIMSDGSKVYHTFDVTDQVDGAENPKRVHIQLDGLEFSEPIPGGDGGFQPDVGEWEEVEVELPMN